jgi:hypothetical protein
MPIVFVHLKLLPSESDDGYYSALDQAPIVAANFIISFQGHKAENTPARDLSLGEFSVI